MKVPEYLESLSLGKDRDREEGIAIIELDSSEDSYGNIIPSIPVNPNLGLHHIFYNQDFSKAYITALNGEYLHFIDLNSLVSRMEPKRSTCYIPISH